MAAKEATPLLYLWQQRTLFIGTLDEPLDISTGASTFMVALEKPIRFMTHEMAEPIECFSLLLPAGLPVIIDTQNGLIANCTLDPLGRDLELLSEQMTEKVGQAHYHANDESLCIESFRELYSSPFNSTTTLASIRKLLKTGQDIASGNKHQIDPRIASVIDAIQTTIGENLSLKALAKQASLSQSRLSELFKRQTGLPIRRYRLWYRLYKTTEAVGEGFSLTEAAMSSGFTDSSHFNRTFRSMLGMKPSSIFNQAKALHVILPGASPSRSALITVTDTSSNTTHTNLIP